MRLGLLIVIAALGPASVAIAAVPPNDDFAGAQVVSTGVAVAGSNVEATSQLGTS